MGIFKNLSRIPGLQDLVQCTLKYSFFFLAHKTTVDFSRWTSTVLKRFVLIVDEFQIDIKGKSALRFSFGFLVFFPEGVMSFYVFCCA